MPISAQEAIRQGLFDTLSQHLAEDAISQWKGIAERKGRMEGWDHVLIHQCYLKVARVPQSMQSRVLASARFLRLGQLEEQTRDGSWGM